DAIIEHPRERDEVEVHREQHELDAHQQQDHVLAVDEDAGHREAEHDRRKDEIVGNRDHPACSLTGSTLTMRSRSSARTATWAGTSCTLRPSRLRIVSVIAATIARRSSIAAISNA